MALFPLGNIDEYLPNGEVWDVTPFCIFFVPLPDGQGRQIAVFCLHFLWAILMKIRFLISFI